METTFTQTRAITRLIDQVKEIEKDVIFLMKLIEKADVLVKLGSETVELMESAGYKQEQIGIQEKGQWRNYPTATPPLRFYCEGIMIYNYSKDLSTLPGELKCLAMKIFERWDRLNNSMFMRLGKEQTESILKEFTSSPEGDYRLDMMLKTCGRSLEALFPEWWPMKSAVPWALNSIRYSD